MFSSTWNDYVAISTGMSVKEMARVRFEVKFLQSNGHVRWNFFSQTIPCILSKINTKIPKYRSNSVFVIFIVVFLHTCQQTQSFISVFYSEISIFFFCISSDHKCFDCKCLVVEISLLGYRHHLYDIVNRMKLSKFD